MKWKTDGCLEARSWENDADWFWYVLSELPWGEAASRCVAKRGSFSVLAERVVSPVHKSSGDVLSRPAVSLPASSLRSGSDIHASDGPLRQLTALAATFPKGCSCTGRMPESWALIWLHKRPLLSAVSQSLGFHSHDMTQCCLLSVWKSSLRRFRDVCYRNRAKPVKHNSGSKIKEHIWAQYETKTYKIWTKSLFCCTDESPF